MSYLPALLRYFIGKVGAAAAPSVALKTDFSDSNANEAWVFW